ncbi:DUF4167 domain-containing protein [Paracoccus benzoatiresistens]|uniref:DUF4167 domain-containing protein n=1 Tax=Paracoccus benzoatiresistens TaxID=2997341 RepID=A0ABT4J9E9_9RHOB|nr:DUF4167 domain-containing protein [Paracoccus sp. EF6]MCZ0963071.1 DUF4167 domain-containing protein [Paracoccus sp. EF6]
MKPHYNRRSGKPRSPQQQRGPGDRVFESTSAKGKLRGTAQQLVERYLQFAEEARLANDRVASEAFLQSAEHYVRVSNPVRHVEDHSLRGRSFRKASIIQEAQSSSDETQRNEPVDAMGTGQAASPELIRLDEARESVAAEKQTQTEAAEKRAAAAADLERIAGQHGYTLEQLGLVLRPA